MPEVKKLKCSLKTKTLMKLAEDLKAELGAEVACDEKAVEQQGGFVMLGAILFSLQ